MRRDAVVGSVLLVGVSVFGLAPGCGDDDGATGADAGRREMGTSGEGGTGDGLTNVVVTRPTAPPIAPATECTVTTAEADGRLSQEHVPSCSELTHPYMPPTGGPHYGIWADYRVYDTPVPWGFLLHSMEHGAVVLAYDCPTGCPDVVAELTAIADEVEDADCEAGDNRMIVAPVPSLGVPIAAVAWGHQYKATCLDGASLRAFVEAHYGRAPEDLCGSGVDVSSFCEADAGVPDGGLPMHPTDAGVSADAAMDANPADGG